MCAFTFKPIWRLLMASFSGSVSPQKIFCCIVPDHMQSAEMRATIGELRSAPRLLHEHKPAAVSQGIIGRLGTFLHLTSPPPAPPATVLLYDAQHQKTLPGTPILHPTAGGNDAECRAFKYATETLKVFKDVFNRDSLDGNGMSIGSTVRFGEDFNNGYFNGEEMVYGEGDGKSFSDFTADIEVIAHELTHGMTASISNLVYQGQSGALNEHISDVFGTIVKQHYFQHDVASANWKMGENVMLGDAFAIRNMEFPGTAYVDHPILGTDPQPNSLANAWNNEITPDNADPHLYSGVANRAFCLTAKQLGGNSWEKAGQIWYQLQFKLGSTETFQSFAEKSVDVAKTLYPAAGSDLSPEAAAVMTAWRTVDVLT